MELAGALFAGVVIAAGAIMFAVAFSLLVGRWVTGDEYWLGFLVRSGLLLLLFGLAFSHLNTVWYWVCIIFVWVPMVDELGIPGIAPLGTGHLREAHVGRAMGDVIEHPQSPFPRVNLAHALLEAGRFEAGQAELEHARALTDEGSRKVIEDMIREVERELLQTCPYCGGISHHAALACRHCLRALVPGLVVSAVVACGRPMLKLLQRRRVRVARATAPVFTPQVQLAKPEKEES